MEGDNLPPGAGLLADLLGQLPLGGLERRLTRHIELPGRNLERVRGVHDLPRLAGQPHMVLVERHDPHRTGMPDLFPGHLGSVLVAEALHPGAQELALPGDFAAGRFEPIHAEVSASTAGASSINAIATSSMPSRASTLTRSPG